MYHAENHVDFFKPGLQLPLIVRGILENNHDITPDIQYRLHALLSEYTPDTALFCAAMTIKEILEFDLLPADVWSVFNAECNRMIARYAACSFHTDMNVYGDALETILEDLPADIEYFAELLKLYAVSGQFTTSNVPEIVKILQIQLSAQSLIAMELLDIFRCERMESIKVPLRQSRDNIVYLNA